MCQCIALCLLRSVYCTDCTVAEEIFLLCIVYCCILMVAPWQRTAMCIAMVTLWQRIALESAASKQTHCFKVCPQPALCTLLWFSLILWNTDTENDEKDGASGGKKSIMSFQSTAICHTVPAPGYHFSHLRRAFCRGISHDNYSEILEILEKWIYWKNEPLNISAK